MTESVNAKIRESRFRIRSSIKPDSEIAQLATLTADPSHPLPPKHAHSSRHNSCRQGNEHSDPKLRACFFVSPQRPRQVVLRRRRVVAEFVHGEDPVSRVGRHHEVGKWPIDCHSRGQETGACNYGLPVVATSSKFVENEIEHKGSREYKNRKPEWDHVRDRREYRAQLRLSWEQWEDPIRGQPQTRIDRSESCSSPAAP